MTYDPERPAGYQDADIEQRELEEQANASEEHFDKKRPEEIPDEVIEFTQDEFDW